ncbi:uridine kinase [Alicyclobacillus sp. SO9]|uniref:uridine kinase n=1 Tax=Alicyclobacillus sp. SO9 TaxID=2665646 RepID=UPI0018E86759|nr:uridine kinase [Alicyclobacillus sp. SO9]QQE78886.1 uridine kinase [Alicyclobacillus sp. SO9]
MLTVGIAGGTGSGKTSVASSIVEHLGESVVTLIPQDAYYKDYPNLSPGDRSRLNYDHPDSFDTELLHLQIEQLKQGQAVQMPVYDFSTHRRHQETILVPSRQVIILEGIHVLVDEQLRDAMDIKIFVDTDPDVRVLRRMLRDVKERGRSVDSVYSQYLQTVKPMHDAFIEPSKRYADLILPEGGENQIGISLVVARIQHFLHPLSSK